MLNWLKNIFLKRETKTLQTLQSSNDGQAKQGFHKTFDETQFVWSLMANVSPAAKYAIEGELKAGTEHFAPNTKLYCFPPLWGDGYENIKVIGRHRKTKRYVCMVIASKHVDNWRLQKVYRPYILKVMYSQKGWTNREADKEAILELLTWLPQRTLQRKSQKK